MKKLTTAIPIALLFFFAILQSCKKELPIQIQSEEVAFESIHHEIRDTVYENPEKTNLALARNKRILKEALEGATAENPFVVFAKITGETVTNSNWNGGVTFTVTMADTSIINQALEIPKKMFSMFKNVLVTTDIALWQAAGVANRIKIIVGNSTVLGPYLGYAWLNCYLWQDDTPAFVLVNNCNPLTLLADIGYGVAHEIGHMFGRPHQYASGGSGFKSWATVMGNWYGKTFVTWTNNDITALEEIFGEIIDDYADTPQSWILKSEDVGKPFKGFITFDDPADVCRMKGSASGPTNITVSSDGGWPIIINIYNKNMVKKYTGNTLLSFSKAFKIPKGANHWYIEVKKYSGGAFPAGYGNTTFSSANIIQQ